MAAEFVQEFADGRVERRRRRPALPRRDRRRAAAAAATTAAAGLLRPSVARKRRAGSARAPALHSNPADGRRTTGQSARLQDGERLLATTATPANPTAATTSATTCESSWCSE